MKRTNKLATEKTMTVKEIAEVLGVSTDTIKNCIRRIMPNKMQNGKTTFLTEVEVASISKELKNNSKVMEQLTYEAGSQVANTTTRLEVLANYKAATEALVSMLEAEKAELQQQLAIAQPKAETYDRIADSTGLKSIQEVAKLLHIGSNSLFSILRDNGILYKTNGVNLPRQEYIDKGYFEVKEEPYERDGKDFVYTRVFATAKGLLWLEKKIKEGE